MGTKNPDLQTGWADGLTRANRAQGGEIRAAYERWNAVAMGTIKRLEDENKHLLSELSDARKEWPAVTQPVNEAEPGLLPTMPTVALPAVTQRVNEAGSGLLPTMPTIHVHSGTPMTTPAPQSQRSRWRTPYRRPRPSRMNSRFVGARLIRRDAAIKFSYVDATMANVPVDTYVGEVLIVEWTVEHWDGEGPEYVITSNEIMVTGEVDGSGNWFDDSLGQLTGRDRHGTLFTIPVRDITKVTRPHPQTAPHP